MATPRKGRVSVAADAADSGKENSAPNGVAKKAGRPKGTGSTRNTPKKPAGKLGRPPGSKNLQEVSTEPTSTRSGRTSKPVIVPIVVAATSKRRKVISRPGAPARGRPRKVKLSPDPNDADVETAPKPRVRGRPKSTATKSTTVTKTKTTTKPKSAPVASGKKRGRPSKTAVAPFKPAASQTGKKRGRPAKTDSAPSKPSSSLTATGKKRGRPSKADSKPTSSSTASGKKRGRPPGALNKSNITEATPSAASKKRKATEAASLATPKKPKATPSETGAKRGRKPKAAADAPPPKRSKPSGEETAAEADVEADEKPTSTAAPARQPGQRLNWLMKAEPESRIETAPSGKKVDIKFSIDDLASRTSPEPWDGIRNAQARNNLRAMRAGDLAFLSESNTKIPGLVGIMEIVGEARPDAAQFDMDSPYYDAKATEDKPRWDAVLVTLRRRFGEKFAAPGAKADKAHKERFGHLKMFAGGRLSVRRVEEWEEVMREVNAREGKEGADPYLDEEQGVVDEVVDDALSLLERIGGGITRVFGSPAKATEPAREEQMEHAEGIELAEAALEE